MFSRRPPGFWGATLSGDLKLGIESTGRLGDPDLIGPRGPAGREATGLSILCLGWVDVEDETMDDRMVIYGLENQWQNDKVCDQSACPCFAIGLSFPDHDFPLSPFYSLDCLLAVSLTHHRSQATRGIAPQPRRVRVCASASNHATIHSISVSTQAKSLAKSSREPDSRLYIPHSL